MSSNAPAQEPKKAFNTQEKAGFRSNWPEWMRQLPRWNFPKEPNPTYQLLDIQSESWKKILADADPDSVRRIEEDIKFLDYELLRLFRERDYKASKNQNLYRVYQIAFMSLAAIATLIGSLQGVSIGTNPNIVPILALLETVIALLTTYLATVSGREPPLPLWITNRRTSEYLRREYFRYIMNLTPYDEVDGYQRKQLLSQRAADINRGIFPDKSGDN